MKRLVFLFAVLVASISTAVAIAAPAPKATGDIGYTAYSDVQRHFTFNAIQKPDTVGTFWDVTGITSFTFFLDGSPTEYVHDAALTQIGQTVGGSGGYPVAGPPYDYAWDVTSGSVVGDTLSLTMVYDAGVPGVIHHMTGTIAADGTITGGTWDDNAGPGGATRTGTFTASGAVATVTYSGKGNAYYSDADGNWYFVNVTALSVLGDEAWFAGPVVAGNIGAGNWLFVKVLDGGEPGKDVDSVWGSFTNQFEAELGVGSHATPGDGPFTITSGNLQVH